MHNSVKTLIMSSITGSQIMCDTFMSLALGVLKIFFFKIAKSQKGTIRSNIDKSAQK